jgi:hypothetical protein
MPSRQHGFILSWPGRHRHDYELQRLVTDGAELKRHAEPDGQRCAWTDIDDRLRVIELPPHLAPPSDDVPYLLHGSVFHGS